MFQILTSKTQKHKICLTNKGLIQKKIYEDQQLRQHNEITET